MANMRVYFMYAWKLNNLTSRMWPYKVFFFNSLCFLNLGSIFDRNFLYKLFCLKHFHCLFRTILGNANSPKLGLKKKEFQLSAYEGSLLFKREIMVLTCLLNFKIFSLLLSLLYWLFQTISSLSHCICDIFKFHFLLRKINS